MAGLNCNGLRMKCFPHALFGQSVADKGVI